MSKEELVQVKAIQLMLVNEMQFTWKEVGANKATIERFARLRTAIDTLYAIETRARRKRMDKGYIINALKSEIRIAGRRK